MRSIKSFYHCRSSSLTEGVKSTVVDFVHTLGKTPRIILLVVVIKYGLKEGGINKVKNSLLNPLKYYNKNH
jgi:hypothetical protein